MKRETRPSGARFRKWSCMDFYGGETGSKTLQSLLIKFGKFNLFINVYCVLLCKFVSGSFLKCHVIYVSKMYPERLADDTCNRLSNPKVEAIEGR